MTIANHRRRKNKEGEDDEYMSHLVSCKRDERDAMAGRKGRKFWDDGHLCRHQKKLD